MRYLFLIGFLVIALAWIGCASLQRRFLFYPSHHDQHPGLTPWKIGDRVVGYAREVAAPKNVWLMCHGNGGQAGDRSYALPCFSPGDAVYILEYPGYGARPGKPSRTVFDDAAIEGYQWLRKQFPQIPVCVLGESIGSGPSSVLSEQSPAPDKIVLVVPFDRLKSVAAERAPFAPVGLILGNAWDNVTALAQYQGPIEIFGAKEDEVIPVNHARTLAEKLPRAQFHLIEGGHNDWSQHGQVQIRNP